MGDIADQIIQDGLDAMAAGEDEDGCEYCGEPGKLRTLDGTPYNCGITQKVLCDGCWAEEMA